MPEIQSSDPLIPAPNPASGQTPAPQPPFTPRELFFGGDGLRAGWSILLFGALFLALLALGDFFLLLAGNRHAASSQSVMSPGYGFVSEAIPFVCVLLATWAMAKIEHRPVSSYGFLPRRGMRNFGAGFAWGLALLSLLIALLRVTGLLVFDRRLLSGSSIVRYGTIWLGNFLIVALFEELLSRGYLQFTLTRGLTGLYRSLFGTTRANVFGFWTAALGLSFAFGFGHRTNPGESPLGLLSAGLIGLVFCLSLWRTDSLWWAIGFHTAWDWAESFLYGVADSGLIVKGRLFATHPVGQPYLSGGLTGPEGSLFLLPVVLAGVAVILFTLPCTNSGYQPASPSQPPLH